MRFQIGKQRMQHGPGLVEQRLGGIELVAMRGSNRIRAHAHDLTSFVEGPVAQLILGVQSLQERVAD
jgi:hypothetical protein